ncbi:MAG: amidohydrolase family protein, partial [Candidatus Krumholzibacteria bacterium]|nr:amidohydrolase family protein [Candidatus Krumholzibacteria bacterium]
MVAVIRIILVLAGVLLSAGCADRKAADLLITGGTIYTMNPLQPHVEAVAVVGDRIVFAGSRSRAQRLSGPRTQVLDLDGNTMLPGLVDAHAHLMGLGKYLAEIKLVGTSSAEEIRRIVLNKQRDVGQREWLLGRGWDQNDWESKEFPTWRDLDGTDSNPVFLRRVDGHAAWLNRTALQFFGIDRQTPDPSGGRILRDSDGNPTGVLVDRAMVLASDRIPEPSLDEKERRVKQAIEECQRYGLTGIHDAQTRADELAIYRRLERQGELGFRIYAILDGDDSTFVMGQLERGPAVADSSYVKVRAIKLYADGALGSRGAALLEPYSDEPAHSGLHINSSAVLERMARRALESGFQMCAHAIGDAGNR